MDSWSHKYMVLVTNSPPKPVITLTGDLRVAMYKGQQTDFLSLSFSLAWTWISLWGTLPFLAPSTWHSSVFSSTLLEAPVWFPLLAATLLPSFQTLVLLRVQTWSRPSYLLLATVMDVKCHLYANNSKFTSLWPLTSFSEPQCTHPNLDLSPSQCLRHIKHINMFWIEPWFHAYPYLQPSNPSQWILL